MSCIHQQRRRVSTWMNPFALCQIADNNYGWPILGKILLQPAEVLSMVRQGVKRWNCAFFQPIKSWIPMYLVSGNSMGRVPSMRLRKRLGFRIFFWLSIFSVPRVWKKERSDGRLQTNQPGGPQTVRASEASGDRAASEAASETPSRDCFNRWWSTGGDSPGWLKGLYLCWKTGWNGQVWIWYWKFAIELNCFRPCQTDKHWQAICWAIIDAANRLEVSLRFAV